MGSISMYILNIIVFGTFIKEVTKNLVLICIKFTIPMEKLSFYDSHNCHGTFPSIHTIVRTMYWTGIDMWANGFGLKWKQVFIGIFLFCT
jgi:predicted glycoside hydrolase/deacetylase ChbG (UPF0249 family)